MDQSVNFAAGKELASKSAVRDLISPQATASPDLLAALVPDVVDHLQRQVREPQADDLLEALPEDIAAAQRMILSGLEVGTIALHQDLTRRAEGVWLLRPLHDIDHGLARKFSDRNVRIDGIRVCLYVIREVAVLNTYDDGPTWAELLKITARAVREQLPHAEAPLVIELARSALRALEARDEENRQFHIRIFDSVTGTFRDRTFSYLTYVRGSDDTYRYRVSEEAALVYAAIADHDLEHDLQAALDKLLDEAIQRGDIDRAMRISATQRAYAMRVQSAIRKLIVDLKTNPEAVSWRGDIQAQVDMAREHLTKRTTEHARVRLNVEERIKQTEDRETIMKLHEFVQMLAEEVEGIDKLGQALLTTHQDFRDGQAQAFKIRRRVAIHDPKEVVAMALSLPATDLVAAFERMFPTFMPPDDIRLVDLDRLFAKLVDDLEPQDERALIDDTGDVNIPVGDDREIEYAILSEAAALLQAALEGKDKASTADIFDFVDRRTGNRDVRRAVGLLTALLYVDDGAPAQMAGAQVFGEFANDIMRGDGFVFRRLANDE